MKKYIALFLVAMMLLPLAYSCAKKDQPEQNNDNEEQEQQPPVTPPAPAPGPVVITAVSEVISFEKNPAAEQPSYFEGAVCYRIITIELTSSNRYYVYEISTSGNTRVLIGKYTYKEGTITCTGEFNAVIEPKEDGKLSITVTAGGKETSIEAKGDIRKVGSPSAECAQAVGSWTIDATYIKVSGKGLSLERAFKGCDIYSIVKYASESGLKADPEKVAGYNISEISFTKAKSLLIYFTGASPYYGTFDVKDTNFSYKLLVGSNDLMNVTANGTLNFTDNNKAVLILSTTADGYSGSLEFDMSKK